MGNDPHIPTQDVPRYCTRCRQVTPHYPADPPDGEDVVWICDECAVIEALIAAAAADAWWPERA